LRRKELVPIQALTIRYRFRKRQSHQRLSKGGGDTYGEIDLMIYLVECGNQFTLEYGDISGPFYDALLSMYAKAVEGVAGLRESDAEPFRKKLWELTKSSDGIGWASPIPHGVPIRMRSVSPCLLP